MFAFAVWDRADRVLTLGRDRMGEKPLYCGWNGRNFFFASELKAMRAHPLFTPDLDRHAVAQFMAYGYVPAPRSIYAGIGKLPPGTLLQVKVGQSERPQPCAYWSLADVASQGAADPLQCSDSQAVDQLEATLSAAVLRQQMSDVPLGAFLSGGIDSSTVVALMQAQSSRPIHTFTIGFQEQGYDESNHARAVAQHLGTHHVELQVSPDQARAVIPQLPDLYDEPFGDSSQIPTFLVSQLAQRDVTVCLTGDGGDELFGGYNRYKFMSRLQAVPVPLRHAAAMALRVLGPAQWDRLVGALPSALPGVRGLKAAGDKAHKLAAVLECQSEHEMYSRMTMSWADPAALTQTAHADEIAVGISQDEWNRTHQLGSVPERMMLIDSLTYLPDDILCKVDRASMGVSLETRVPFLDPAVVEFSWRLPLHMKIRNGQGKWIVQELLARHVPRALFNRPKMGFGVPIDSWLRGPLRDWAQDLLNRQSLERDGYLNPPIMERVWNEHLSGRCNWQHTLWNALMFQAWRRRWC
jgi:asparagine synthase (glutamine-hydrolysing)